VLLAVLGAAVLFAGAVGPAEAGTGNYTTLYLSGTASTLLGAGSYQLVTNTTPVGGAPPATEGRIAATVVGYQPFQPGFQPASVPAPANTPATTASASTTPSNKGWIVDGAGAVSFPAGTWTFNNTFTQTWNGTGFATLAVGMWKVSISGGTVSSPTLLVDPNCSSAPCLSGAAPGAASPGTGFITATGTPTAISLPVAISGFSLASGEHLYVQYWRWQSVGMQNTAGAANRLATMSVNDGTSDITHPTANGFPDMPALVSPGARINNTTPSLAATFSDPDPGDTGTVAFQLCSDAACGTVLQSGSSPSGIANGANGSWMPTALAEGTYYWRAQSTDSAGNVSGWPATSSFVVDTTPPGAPTAGAPASAARVNSTQLNATFVDSDPTDSGAVNFQVCTTAACSTVATSGSSATVGGGAAGSWTASGLADGTYYWRVQDQDVAGNVSAWSAAQSFVLDTNPPGVPGLSGPADASYLGAVPTLGGTFSSSDTGDSGTVSFEVCSDAACGTVEASGSSASGLANGATGTWTPGGLADGLHYWRASAQDAAGNVSAWSAPLSFSVDTTAPSVPPLGAVAARSNNTTPTLAATFSDPPATDSGSVAFQLCADSGCTSIVQNNTASGVASNATANWTPASLADGAYYWRARATDSAGNVSAWSAANGFVVDTTPPGLPAFVSPAATGRINSVQLHATFVDSDATDSGNVDFQLCGDAGCASVVASGSSATVSGGTAVSFTPGALADGTYYWRLRGDDVAGNQSAWTATRSFVLDTNPPDVPSLNSPAEAADVGSVPTLRAFFTTGDAGDSGKLDYQLCSDSGCTAVVQSGSSVSGLVDGTSGGWTPAALADGGYYWRARAVDAAGNQSAWSAARQFTLDTGAPSVPAVAGSGATVLTTTLPTLTTTYIDSSGGSGSVTFQVCSTAACTTVQASTTVGAVADNATASWTPTKLPDGTYYWRVQSTDSAGNLSGWSATRSFTFDDTPPAVPVPTVDSGVSVRTEPQLTARIPGLGNAPDSARILVELCRDSGCSGIITTGYSSSVPVGTVAGWQAPALADGVYYWRALAEDLAGNQSSWSVVRSFVVDTTAPPVPEAGGPAAGAVVNSARLSGTPADAGTGGSIEFEVCADAGCAQSVATGFAANTNSGAAPTWTPASLSDGLYFWRVRALDDAGNASAWTAPKSFVLDQTPPSMPRGLTAKVVGKTLTLRWQAPSRAAHLTGYALLVNGKKTRVLNAKTHSVRIKLRRVETRWFAVAALDAAGNVGLPTKQIGPETTRPTPPPRRPAQQPGRP